MIELRCASCGLKIDRKPGSGGTPKYHPSCRPPSSKRSHGPIVPRPCLTCRVVFVPRWSRAKYCSRHCGEIARGQRLPEPIQFRQCALTTCDVEFRPKRLMQMCCSEKHGKLHYNRVSRADGRQPREPWNDRRRDIYHRRRARRKAASTGARVLLIDIADRDGWACHICGHPVDQMCAWPAPTSPSLDHVVPLSRGGAHEPSNVRLAHLICNSMKGARLDEELSA